MIEDTRKVLQDFIAPELRAIDARLTSLEKRFEEAQRQTEKRFEAVDKRFERLEEHMNERFDNVLETVDDRFEKVLAEIRQLKSVHDLELRMAKYEAALNASQQQQPAKPSSSEAA